MPKAHQQRSHRSASHNQSLGCGLPFIYLAALIIIGGLLLSWFVSTFTGQFQAYTVVGSPSVDAAFINRVLDHYHSPARGKGQTLYDYGVKYNIDPAFALAFFMHESTFGTRGVATTTHSLGNIRATYGYPQYDGYRLYRTWEEGFEDWYRLIADQYVAQWGLSTIDQIIPVYAPSSDNNDEDAYIQSIKTAVDTWRKGEVEVV